MKQSLKPALIVTPAGEQVLDFGQNMAGVIRFVNRLPKGQSLSLSVGGEVMLRVGSAACGAASAPGLIDETTAGSVDNGGALVKNHLYMSTIDGRTVKATSDGVKLLVRGSYSIN